VPWTRASNLICHPCRLWRADFEAAGRGEGKVKSTPPWPPWTSSPLCAIPTPSCAPRCSIIGWQGTETLLPLQQPDSPPPGPLAAARSFWPWSFFGLDRGRRCGLRSAVPGFL